MASLLPKELVETMYQDFRSLAPWLLKYLKPTGNTVREMTDSMNMLRSRMKPVVRKLEEICHNNWSPRDQTIEWIHKGLDYNTRVEAIVKRYIHIRDRHSDGGSAAESMLHCPCDTVLSSRQINMEAVNMIVDVTRHYTDGEKYEAEDYETVAVQGAKYSDVLQDLKNLIPKVEKLERYSEEVFFCPRPSMPPHVMISVCDECEKEAIVISRRRKMRAPRAPGCAREGQSESVACSLQPSSPVGRSEVLVSDESGLDPRYFPAILPLSESEPVACSLQPSSPVGRSEVLVSDESGLAPRYFPARLPLPENIEKPELSAFSKYRALSRSEEEDSTPVMIRVKAQRYTYGCRSPIDLVMVLDITGSMAGEKLSQIKQGALFVLRNLQAEDRLSVVALDKCTHMLFPLTYLSDEETKAWAKTKIAELPLVAAAPSDIILAPAMEAVHQILTQRVGNRLARVMVLTEGLDGKAMAQCRGNYPTYTFGLGPEHDRWKAYGVASESHGTYSFDSTADLKSIGAAMALCIGGLTSIAAQRIEVSIRSEQAAGVRISRITSGAYDNHVRENGTLGSIIVDDIYSSEEKNFLVYVNVPKDEAGGGFFPRTTKTKLLTVEAKYYSPVNHYTVRLDPVEVSVERKGQTQASSQAVGVASEVIRARVLEEVAKIADTVSSQEVGSTDSGLAALRITVEDTPEAKAAKDTWDGLRTDLDSMEDSETGLAFMLSWLTSHQWQRASMPGSVSKINFRTTRMKNLIDSVDLAPVDMHPRT